MLEKYVNCEFLYEDGVENFNRVVRLSDGRLFSIAMINKKNVSKIGKYTKHQFVFGRLSTDDGRTWSMPYPLFEMPDTKAYLNAAAFMISRDGYLHVFIIRITNFEYKSGLGESKKDILQGDILHARMDDIIGKNLKIQKIECLDRYTGSLNNLIQLKSGRLLIPFSTIVGYPSYFVSSTIYSDDEGLSWKASNDITVESNETHCESGAVEPVVVEVRDNVVVMIIRTVLDYFYYSVSYDGGMSWSNAKPTNIRSSNAPAVLQEMPDGRILIVWNQCYGMPMRGVQYSFSRQCMHAAISEDGLKTLKGLRVIVKKEPGDPDEVLNCYPFSDVADNKSAYIRFFTVNTKDQEDWSEPNGKLIRLPIDFLCEDEIKCNFNKDTDDWVTDYVNTCLTEDGDNKVLAIRSDKDEIGYVCVNFPYGQEGKIKLSVKAGEGFKHAKLLFSECYLDKSNFVGSESEKPVPEKYLDRIRESYMELGLGIDQLYYGLVMEKGKDREIEIRWSVEKGILTAKIDASKVELSIPESFKGFNYMSIVLPEGEKQELIIKSFEEVSSKAGLDTGINVY